MATISGVSSNLVSLAPTKDRSYGTDPTGRLFNFELYKRTVVNALDAKPEDAHHIGYLDKNKTALEVQGTITRQNRTNYFSFRFRKGETTRLMVDMNKGVRVQLYDSNGIHLLADSDGTDASKKKVYQNWKEGLLGLKNGDYLIKVTYSPSAEKNKTLNYDLTLTSGNSYKGKYKTLAQATTVYNSMLEGKTVGRFNPKTTAASVLYNAQNGEDTNIFDFYT